ncbi:hypothetical protein JZ751_025424 [Albula glossodonta]|uniref:Uncharacterized protein n=1 Tax=Albula glossodonta TaxID=121402 RepID=A0A8T2MXM4_9TELE|nr:hypothetical protein JZ751_025424 [Albula glossodonta]
MFEKMDPDEVYSNISDFPGIRHDKHEGKSENLYQNVRLKPIGAHATSPAASPGSQSAGGKSSAQRDSVWKRTSLLFISLWIITLISLITTLGLYYMQSLAVQREVQEQQRNSSTHNTELQKQLGEKEQENSQLQKQLGEKEQENSQLQSQLEDKEKENSQLQKQLGEKEQENSQLQKQLVKKRQENSNLQKQLREKEQEFSDLHTRFSSMRASYLPTEMCSSFSPEKTGDHPHTQRRVYL